MYFFPPISRLTLLRSGSVVLSLIKFTIIAFLIITPFRYFVVQPFIVSGASMEPAFDAHEYLVVDRLTYRLEEPERGDVVIFRYPLDPSLFYVKRVIGLPGERIEMRDGVVTIIPAHGSPFVLNEPYAHSSNNTPMQATTLERDEYFVLGDNRSSSSDSRTWGPLKERYLIGRALMRLFPARDITFLPGEYRFGGE